jgi:hypothetical protein
MLSEREISKAGTTWRMESYSINFFSYASIKRIVLKKEGKYDENGIYTLARIN